MNWSSFHGITNNNQGISHLFMELQFKTNESVIYFHISSIQKIDTKSEIHNHTPDRRQSKMLIPSANVVKKIVLIVICRLTGNKRQWKSLFLGIYYPRSSIVKNVFVCPLSSVNLTNPLITQCALTRRMCTY